MVSRTWKKVIDDLMDGRVLKVLDGDHERLGMSAQEVATELGQSRLKVEEQLGRLLAGGWVTRHLGTVIRYRDRHAGEFHHTPGSPRLVEYFTLARQVFPQEGGRS